MKSLHRFPLFDRTGEFDDHREVLDQPTILEPHDDRTDGCVSVPIRSVVSSIAGPAVEFGPFTLDSDEVVKLHNALVSHINSFPSMYRMKSR
jgi:hypothetical protein